MTGTLVDLLVPPGPVLDVAVVERQHAVLCQAADEGAWRDLLDQAWPAIAPVFAASPYLFSLARRRPQLLQTLLQAEPSAHLTDLLGRTRALEGGVEEARVPLRQLKSELHLLTALADLGGIWSLDQVTGALADFADVASQAALRAVAHDQRERGKLISGPEDVRGPVPGLFGLAMGKHGARELNYSSDIDVSLFWDPDGLIPALADDVEPQRFVDRLAHAFSGLMQDRTADGYVFRVDLRLRPDPSSTPPVVAVPVALPYYESVGQNWERAAFIKARPMLGDQRAGERFVQALTPFVWRRSLDYPAILDIQSIKRQIHVHKAGAGLEAAGANLKLGRGGIREIEFFVQTQQLILGGRDASLRSPRTVDALADLARTGHIAGAVAAELTQAYGQLRSLEHRVQMLDDEQTHILPLDPDRRRAVAALAGQADLQAFDASVQTLLLDVNRRYGELFAEAEPLSSPFGSLVFTGIENDPETLLTLERMGFSDPAGVAETIRGWHHGRIPATRSARGRELFTRLAPRLLTAVAETGTPDDAFRRFSVFFAGLSAGVQVQALFLNQPDLFELIVGVMAYAPRLARTLGRYPAALDSVLDSRLLQNLDEDSGLLEVLDHATSGAENDFEESLNAARRLHRDQMFRIGLQVLTGRADAEAAGRAYSSVADGMIQAMARAALAEIVRTAGPLQEGQVAVVALGKVGSREMTAASDLDLMTVYAAPEDAVAPLKDWAPPVWYSRFTQRMIAALSAHTAEGGLYEVDMRLRPGGSKGPVSLRLSAVEDYYAGEADTWEFMALTRARVVWASDPSFAGQVQLTLERILRRPRPEADVRADARRMRDLMARERPASGFWDLKLSSGGQVDAEFLAQVSQLDLAASGGALTVSTLEALNAMPEVGAAWRMQQRLSQILSAAFHERPDPAQEPERLQRLLAQAAGFDDFPDLIEGLTRARQAARQVFEAQLPPVATES